MRTILTQWFSGNKGHADLQNDVLVAKYAKSGLTQQEAYKIKQKVQQAFESDKLFKDNSIGLNDLSRHIDQDRYKVSQVLNEYLNKNFYSLLNHYRVQEAKELLLSHPLMSVKAIMYEVGFNSKASFYSAFKKETGLSPNDYRNLVLYAS